ncbi:MAG TPA: hypothetical protein VFD70_19650 [Anaerolineae bacterium]|nr:hypothetical protein [Anaerolineae bacterium]
MSIQDIHFIREILVKDYAGNAIPTLQASYANASCLNPKFKAVPFYELEKVRALYLKLGGGRLEHAQNGTTVIIPNRSRWANLWGISAEEVRVVESRTDALQSLRADPSDNERARARNRLMRD